jgi:hypothetical protein
LLIVLPLPSKVPENGVPVVAMPTVHVQPVMFTLAVNLYELAMAPDTAADSRSHWSFAGVSIS